MAPYRPSRTLSRRMAAFSLVELLIVLGILALLAAILLPVFASTRERARTASCASNLRQIGMAIQLYVNDTQHYPTIVPPGLSCTWSDKLWPYVKAPGVFECPSSDSVFEPGCPFHFATPHQHNMGAYDLNDLRDGHTTIHFTLLRHPSSTILVVDGRGEYPVWTNPGRDPITGTQDLLTRGVIARHNNGDNVLMADGHTKWLSFDAMTQRSLWLASGSD